MRSKTSDENPKTEHFHRAVATLIVASLLAGATYAVSRLSHEPGEGGTVFLDPGAASIRLDLRANRVLVETGGQLLSLTTSRDQLGTPGAGGLGRFGAQPDPARAEPRSKGAHGSWASLRPRGLAIADFGGEGRRVVAVSDFSNNAVMLLGLELDPSGWPLRTPAIGPSQPLSPGSAALAVPVSSSSVPVPAGPRGLAAADLDGDGRDDLAVASSVAQVVTVFLGRGSEAIEPADSIEVPGIPVEVSFVAETSALGRRDAWGAAIGSREGRRREPGLGAGPAEAADSGEPPAVVGRFAGVLLVTLADGAVLRYRSLGGGRFDHHAETVRRAEEGNVDTRDGSGGAMIGGAILGGATIGAATSAAASAGTREAASLTTPTIDFAALGACGSSLPMPAKKIALVVKLVTQAESLFGAAAAGTNPKKFAKPAALLNRYIATINGQVGISIDRAAADACVVPAQEDVDAILLIGVPASLAVDGGDEQTARPFAQLPLPLTVKAEDVYSNGIPKFAVSFALVSGTARLGALKAKTGTDGKASTTLTFLGPPDGAVQVQATAATAAPVLFSLHKVTGTISLAGDVQPIFTGNCALSGCHAGPSPQQGQNLSAGNLYNPTTGIVGVTSHEAPPLLRVNPGHPESSYLVNKIEGTQLAAGGTGSQMPRGRPPLSQANRFLIETWIAQGAANN